MTINYEYIGWYQDLNSDKVWVCIKLSSGKYLTVWGRRGKRLQHKIIECSSVDAHRLVMTKARKGYRRFDKTELDQVYPEFEQDLEQTTAWSMLMAWESTPKSLYPGSIRTQTTMLHENGVPGPLVPATVERLDCGMPDESGHIWWTQPIFPITSTRHRSIFVILLTPPCSNWYGQKNFGKPKAEIRQIMVDPNLLVCYNIGIL